MFKSFTHSFARHPVRVVTRSHHLYSRIFPPIHDFISPQPSYLLGLSLSPYLKTSPPASTQLPVSGDLPPGHHMVYFPSQLQESQLLADGSDAEQSPGPEWVRRMWAGGSVHFHPTKKLQIMDHGVLKESVTDVQARGKEGGKEEKMFVWFERRMWAGKQQMKAEELEEGQAAVVERRCLVFFKESRKDGVVRVLKPPHQSDFSLCFTPTQHLLFRFSALTFNAHKIHFDPLFTQSKEKYSGLLCHGPMALVFLLELLRINVLDTGKERRWCVKKFDYKCLAPMYVDQPYKICGRKVSDKMYELWAETPEGGYSVKGLAILGEDNS